MPAELVNKAFRVILVAVDEVVGKHGTESLLRQAGLPQYINNFPPSDNERGGHLLKYMSQINRALFDVYGKRGARAILVRSGRSRAVDAIAQNGAVANGIRLATKFLPLKMKVKLALDRIAKEYSEQLGTTVKISEEGDAFFWEDLYCGNCIDWQADAPVCFTTIGFLHGLLAWLLENEDFKIEEITCRAKSDPTCKYKVTISQ